MGYEPPFSSASDAACVLAGPKGGNFVSWQVLSHDAGPTEARAIECEWKVHIVVFSTLNYGLVSGNNMQDEPILELLFTTAILHEDQSSVLEVQGIVGITDETAFAEV